MAAAVTDDLNDSDADFGHYLLSPAIPYGAAGEHEGFAGTISIGTDALTSVLVEYGRSACSWAQRLVFVNGHGGNVEALRSAVAQLRSEHRDVTWCACLDADGDAHAGTPKRRYCFTFRPLMSALRTGVAATTRRLVGCCRRCDAAVWQLSSEVGILGDPTTATRAEGARIFADMAADCARRVRRWEPRADGFLT